MDFIFLPWKDGDPINYKKGVEKVIIFMVILPLRLCHVLELGNRCINSSSTVLYEKIILISKRQYPGRLMV